MSLLDEEIKRLEKRRDDLRPAVEEYQEAEQALAALRTAREEQRWATQFPKMRLSLADRKQMVIEALKVRGDGRIKDLAATLNVSVPRAVQIVNELEHDGVVERGDGKIRLKFGN